MSEDDKPVYTCRCVQAEMAEIFTTKKVSHQVGTKTVTKHKGLFGLDKYEEEQPVYETQQELVPTGEKSDTHIDGDDFARRITSACNELHEQGYDVLSIIPTVRGAYETKTNFGIDRGVLDKANGGWGWGWGYGYSVTDSVMIFAKLLNAGE